MDEPILPPTAPARTRAIRGLVISAIVLFVLGIAVIGWTLLRSKPEEAVPPALAPAPALLPDATSRPTTSPLSPADTATRIATIESRLAAADRMSNQALADAAKAERLLILLSTRRAIDRGQPLAYLEPALAQQFGGAYPGDVTLIVDHARRPVRLDALADELALLEPTLITRAGEEGWLSGILSNVRTLAVVRKADQPSDVPAKKLERARRALVRDDVELAVREIATMPGASKAKAWLEKARRYVAVHAALDRLEAATILSQQPQK